MNPQKKYELTIRSAVVKGEKPTKGLEAVEADSPHTMHRITGFLTDGTEVVVAQRPGKGGMDFNKLMGGKVYAVAADGMSPVYEKDAAGSKTKIQKQEAGKPLYSSSGFYLLSSKEYPALDIFEAFTLLTEKGDSVYLLSPVQVAAKQRLSVASELDWDLLQSALAESLADSLNFVTRFDDAVNKKRRRGIEAAKNEADDAEEKYAGVEFKELSTSKKDGNPFILYSYKHNGSIRTGFIQREAHVIDTTRQDGRVISSYFSAQEAMARFIQTPEAKELADLVAAGTLFDFSFVQGHLMRTSVSFKRKCENVLASPPEKALYGDAVFIMAALSTWTKGLVALMYSKHPNFPTVEYDAHYYVVGCRQAEIGMNKKPGGVGWVPPAALQYDLPLQLAA